MVERMTERKLTNLVQCKYNLHDLRWGAHGGVQKMFCSAVSRWIRFGRGDERARGGRAPSVNTGKRIKL